MENSFSSDSSKDVLQRVATSHPLLVVSLAMFNSKGEILLAQRPKGKQYEDLWEFPGGKVEVGESKKQALIREIKEELGITLDINKLASPITYAKSAEIEIFLYIYFEGEVKLNPIPQEKQKICWVSPSEMKKYSMPPLDIMLCNDDFNKICNKVLTKL